MNAETDINVLLNAVSSSRFAGLHDDTPVSFDDAAEFCGVSISTFRQRVAPLEQFPRAFQLFDGEKGRRYRLGDLRAYVRGGGMTIPVKGRRRAA